KLSQGSRAKFGGKNPKGLASMAANQGTADTRARAMFRHRASALAARGAILVLALYLIVPPLVSGTLAIDPLLAAVVAGALLIAACGALALLARRNRLLEAENARLDAQAEELGDRNWELKELAERSHTFVEALADVMVRRNAAGQITYANEAFCRIAGL